MGEGGDGGGLFVEKRVVVEELGRHGVWCRCGHLDGRVGVGGDTTLENLDVDDGGICYMTGR